MSISGPGMPVDAAGRPYAHGYTLSEDDGGYQAVSRTPVSDAQMQAGAVHIVHGASLAEVLQRCQQIRVAQGWPAASQVAEQLTRLRSEFPHLAFLFDPNEGRWVALHGTHQTWRAATCPELREQLLSDRALKLKTPPG